MSLIEAHKRQKAKEEENEKYESTDTRKTLMGFDADSYLDSEENGWRDVSEILDTSDTKQGRRILADIEGGSAKDYKERKREGLMESGIVKGIKALMGEEHKWRGEQDIEDLRETQELDVMDTRQLMSSNRELHDLLVEHARQQLGDPAAEAVAETWEHTGHELGDTGLVDTVVNSIQKTVDATIPFYIATGLRRRIFEDTAYEMPYDFKFHSDIEEELKRAVYKSVNTGEPVSIGYGQGLMSKINVTPDMDVDAAREIAWNNQLAFLRNNVASQVQNGTAEDISMLVTTLGTLGTLAVPKAGASIVARGAATGLKALDVAGSAPTLKGAAKLAAKLGTNTKLMQSATKMGSAVKASIPLRIRPLADLGGKVLNQSVSFAGLGALSNLGEEKVGAVSGAIMGGALPVAFGGLSAFKNTLVPSNTYVNWGNPVQRNLVTSINEEVSNRIDKVSKERGGIDARAFNYAVRESVKNPGTRKQLEQLHDLLNPSISVQGRINQQAVKDVGGSLSSRLEALEGLNTQAAATERKNIGQLQAVFRRNRNTLVNNSNREDFLEFVKKAMPDVYSPLKRQLQEVTHQKEAYLTRYLSEVLSSPFASGKVDIGDATTNNLRELGISDQLFKGLNEAMNPGRLTDIHNMAQAVSLQYKEITGLADAFRTDLITLGVNTSFADTAAKAIREGSLDIDLKSLNLKPEIRSELSSALGDITSKIAEYKRVQARLAKGVQTVQGYISRRGGEVSEKFNEGIELGLSVGPDMFRRIKAEVEGLRNPSVSRLMDDFQSFRTALQSGSMEDIVESIRTKGQPTRILESLRALSKLSRQDPSNLELRMAKDILNDYVSKRKPFLREIDNVFSTLTELNNETSMRTRIETLSRLQGETSTPYLRSLVDSEKIKLKPMLEREISETLGLTGEEAKYVSAWQLGDGEAIARQIVDRQLSGDDISDLLTNQFTGLTKVYGKLSSDLLDSIAEDYFKVTGSPVNKAYLHGMFLRSDDSQAVMRAFKDDVKGYAEAAAAGAMRFKRNVGDTPQVSGRLAHSISQEYLSEEGTGVSAGVVMGGFQHDANHSMNRVGAFFNDEVNKDKVERLTTELRKLSYSDQYTVQDMMKLLDGVEGVSTLMYSCDLDGNFQRTYTGELMNRLLSTDSLYDEAAAQKIVKELVQDPNFSKGLSEQLVREGNHFRLANLTDEGILDVSGDKFASSFVQWAQNYMTPVRRSASKELWSAAENLYGDVRRLDAAVSRQSLKDASDQASKYGYALDPLPHRSNRPVGQSHEESIGVLSDMKLDGAGRDRVNMMGRRFGTSDTAQILKANERSLRDTVDLTNNVIFDATRRIQDVNIAHAKGELTRHIDRLDGLGFTAYAKMFRDFRDLDISMNHMANVADSIYRSITRTNRGSSMLKHMLSGTTTLVLDSLDVVFTPFAFLGRITKPFKEAFQALYTLTMASPSSYTTMLGWKNAVTLLGSAFINTARAASGLRGIVTKQTPSEFMPTPRGSKLSMQMGRLSNELVAEAYTQSSKFVGARKLMRTAQSDSPRLGGVFGTYENVMGRAYQGTADLFMYTKELQEAFSSRTGARIAENILTELDSLHRQGASMDRIFQTFRKQYWGSVTDIQLSDTLLKLFKDVPPGGLAEKLQTSEGALAYKTFAGLVHDTTIGRFGGSAGGGLSRVASRIAPGLGMYSVPKSQFIDRLIVKPVLAMAMNNQAGVKTLVPTVLGGCIYLLYQSLVIETLEGGTDNIGSEDSFGNRSVLGGVADSWGNVVTGIMGELSQDPQYQSFLNSLVRTGTGVPLSLSNIEPRVLKTLVKGESDLGALSQVMVMDILGLGGTERGVGNVLGVGAPLAFFKSVGPLSRMTQLGVYGGRVEKGLNDLHNLDGQTWQSREEYQEAVMKVVNDMVSTLPKASRDTIRDQILANNGQVSAELQEELITLSQEAWLESVARVGLNTPMAPAFHLFNPSVMAAAYKEFILDPDGLQSMEEWGDLRKHFGVMPTGSDIPTAEKFASRMYRVFREANVISDALYERKMEEFENYWQETYLPQVHPDLQAYYQGEQK